MSQQQTDRTDTTKLRFGEKRSSAPYVSRGINIRWSTVEPLSYKEQAQKNGIRIRIARVCEDCKPLSSTPPLTLRQEEQYRTIGARSRPPALLPDCLPPEPVAPPPLAFAEPAVSAGKSPMPTGAWQKLHLAGGGIDWPITVEAVGGEKMTGREETGAERKKKGERRGWLHSKDDVYAPVVKEEEGGRRVERRC